MSPIGQIMYCTNCATLETQAEQYAQQISTELNTARQLETQIQQYQNMIQQGLALPSTEFSNITSSLRSLEQIYSSSNALAGQLQDFTTRFQSDYPGFDTYLQKAGGDPAGMSTFYQNWSQNTTAAAQTAMQSSGMNVNQIPGETATLGTLVQQSQTAAGRLQAIQAGNQISAMMVQQLQKMRTMLNDQTQAAGTWQAQQAASVAAKMAADQKFLSGTLDATTPNQY